jgi:hypothetical protein
MDLEGYGRKKLSLLLRYYPGILLEELKENYRKILVNIASLHAKISIQNLQNIRQKS